MIGTVSKTVLDDYIWADIGKVSCWCNQQKLPNQMNVTIHHRIRLSVRAFKVVNYGDSFREIPGVTV